MPPDDYLPAGFRFASLGRERATVPTRSPLQPDDPGPSLALAMVCSSPTPLLMLDPDCRIIAASVSFCTAFDIEPSGAVGNPLFDLGLGEWDVPQLRVLIAATASGYAEVDTYEMDLQRVDRPPRRIIVNVRNLTSGVGRQVRLLVAVHDATEERAQAKRGLDLARDNALLMQETRHRIANSLQIIASVIMMNARRASSEETRGYLRDAHSRVMSIAELQRQLAQSTRDSVSIGEYLTRLCETISASMISHPDELSIRVEAPNTAVSGAVSVSLGLIVTELLINALKHAFPDRAGGRIDVRYWRDSGGWTLTVEDDGVGMGAGLTPPVGGLGTSIVRALAQQLRARVEVLGRNPGTRVSIVHEQTLMPDGRIAEQAPEPAA